MFFDQYGNLLVNIAAGGGGGGGGSSDVAIHDNTTPTNHLAIDSSGRLTLVPNQPFELVDSGGVNKVSVDALGNLRSALYGKGAGTPGDTAIATDASGNVGVNVIGALPAGANLLGKVNIQIAGAALATAAGDGTANNTVLLAAQGLYNGTNVDRTRSIGIGDAVAATGIPANGLMLYNGTTYDRLRGTSGAANVLLQAGAANIGGVEILDSGGVNKLAIDSSGRLTLVPNQVIEIGDGTTPTQKLAIDASGRLTLVPNQTFELVDSGGTNKATVDGSGNLAVKVTNGNANGQATMANSSPVVLPSDQTVAVNLSQVLGAALSISNPDITETNIQNAIRNGKAYTACYRNTTAASALVGLSVFNNSTAKNILIYSVSFGVGVAASINGCMIQLTTSDPALGTAVTPSNAKAGGAASGATCSATNTNVSAAGTLFKAYSALATTPQQVFMPGESVLLPASAANGLVMYVTAATTSWGVNISWIEF